MKHLIDYFLGAALLKVAQQQDCPPRALARAMNLPDVALTGAATAFEIIDDRRIRQGLIFLEISPRKLQEVARGVRWRWEYLCHDARRRSLA